jgi:hypothetical protein
MQLDGFDSAREDHRKRHWEKREEFSSPPNFSRQEKIHLLVFLLPYLIIFLMGAGATYLLLRYF